MCGIAGIIRRPGGPSLTQDHLRPMLAFLHHRGPDDEGYLAREPVAMGMRRLAVVDLSGGRQPIWNEDHTVAIVYNGEIYNHRALRADLERGGHMFRTRSDTETIVHAWEEYGTECVRHLRGMFAFSLYDWNRQVLFCARDRVGKKPLFYQVLDGELRWASEIKPLLAVSVPRPGVAEEGLAQFLTFGYSTGETTCFQGVQRLLPGHWLLWEDGRLRVEQYWAPPPAAEDHLDAETLRRRVRDTVEDAVRVRLESDVPLGAMLSGGIDSSVVVGVMAGAIDRPVKTFCVGFEDRSFDERHYARAVASHFGTEHHEKVVRADDLLAAIPRMVWHLEEPNLDPAFLPTYFVARMCREQVTVALNGDGGDEAFGGYGRYAAALLAQRLRWVPAPLLRAARAAVSLVGSSGRNYELRGRLLKWLEALLEEGDMRFVAMLRAFSPQWQRALLTEHTAAVVTANRPQDCLLAHLARVGAGPTLYRLAASDYLQPLPDQLLVKADRAAMAASLEARSPLLDQQVVELGLALPDELKIHGGVRKWLLRQAFADLLPLEVLAGGKRAFNVPLARWFRGELGLWAERVLLSERALDRGLVRRDGLASLLEQHRRGRADHSAGLWGLLLLELWQRMFMDDTPPTQPPALDREATMSLLGT